MTTKQEASDILGVSLTASEEEIKKAYKQLAFKWHPDRNADNLEEANKKFLEVKTAYEFLTSSSSNSQTNNNTKSPHQRHVAGATVELSFAEIINGKQNAPINLIIFVPCGECKTNTSVCHSCNGKGTLEINGFLKGKGITCIFCGGTGKGRCKACNGRQFKEQREQTTIAFIPPGMRYGTTVELDGLPINVLPVNQELPDNVSGVDLSTGDVTLKLPLEYPKFFTNESVDIQLLTGEQGKIRIPRNAKPEQIIRLKGKGLPTTPGKSEPRGNLLFQLELTWPKQNYTKEQIEKLKTI